METVSLIRITVATALLVSLGPLAFAQSDVQGLGLECSTLANDAAMPAAVFKTAQLGATGTVQECQDGGESSMCGAATPLNFSDLHPLRDGTVELQVDCTGDGCPAVLAEAIIVLPPHADEGPALMKAVLSSAQDPVAVHHVVCHFTGQRIPQPTPPPTPSPTPAPELRTEKVVCTSSNAVEVFAISGSGIAFSVGRGTVIEQIGGTKTIRVGRRTDRLTEVIFESGRKGWLEAGFIRERASCQALPPPLPKPAPTPPPPPPLPVDAAALAPLKTTVTCAEKVILSAAKKFEFDHYKNRPEGGGTCAFGVNRELWTARVGYVDDGFGYGAVDFLNALPQHGYVDIGERDPLKAPAGAVIVFAGPNSDLYLKTGAKKGASAGDWAGHVTIKGDDGFYYTDGRTQAPAIGWSTDGINVAKIRNVVGIFVPGPSLVAEFADSCADEKESKK